MAISQMQASGTPVDVAEFIDQQPVGGFQIGLLLTCAAVLFLDGFDTQAIGYVAPALAKEWGLTKAALGPVFSAGLFGLMIGALMFGPLADRIGRKKIIIFSTLAFGLGTLATAFVQDVGTLLTIRFLTGLGLGGAMPNAVAMTSEFSPHRRRATMVMIMFCGFSVGAALGGLLAAALIPQFGWRSVFVAGGLAPLLLVPVLALRLPESVRFIALSGRAHERVAELLTRINPGAAFAPGTQFAVHEPRLAGLPVLHLFRDGRTLATLLLWVVFFMSLLDLYFLSNWLPTVLNDLGASVSSAAVIGSMLQVGGVVGTFALGSVIDRFSFRAGAGLFRRGVCGGCDRPTRPLRHLRHHGDFRRGLLHRRRPDRRQCAGGDILSDIDPVDRRRLGAWNRPSRIDRGPAGRRRAADHEMEHRGSVHGGCDRGTLRGAGGLFAEPGRGHPRRWQGRGLDKLC
jgi:AAHS family 4-hydroxybenzoate transporter-like MFS transporter